MKKVKVAFWLIIIVFLATIIWQNRPFFFTQQALSIDLLFEKYNSPQLPIVVIIGFFFLMGWLIASLFYWIERFKSAKNIKKLQQTIHSQQSAIEIMKADVDTLKNPEQKGDHFQQTAESGISLETKPADPSDFSAERVS